MKIRVAVVGATGYSGLELIKILLRHPDADLAAVMASESRGERPLGEIHQQLRGRSSLVCTPQDPDQLAALRVQTVFLCTPNEVSYELAPRLLSLGMKVVDLSGSFRLRDGNLYGDWYGFRHEEPAALNEAVYGLPERHAEEVRTARLIANPGCYPTSVLLALLPISSSGMLQAGAEIVCDSKSGVTGAGRTARADLLFGEVSENFRPYNPVTHRHAPEICQELEVRIEDLTFVPHLLPINRGILSTIYVRFASALRPEEIAGAYESFYAGRPFIRILGDSRLPEIRAVNHTNFCDISWRLTRGGRCGIIFSAIDNLIKGAAGQAVQNFNLMHGLDEAAGLAEGVPGAAHD